MEVPALEQADEDRELVRGAEAVAVRRRVGLGVPLRDRLLERRIEAESGLHARADVGRRAVEQAAYDARTRSGEHACPGDQRDRGGDGGLESQLTLGELRRFVERVPLLGDELLVRGHDVPTALEGRVLKIASAVDAADHFAADVHYTE